MFSVMDFAACMGHNEKKKLGFDFFFYKWLLEGSWGPTLASPSFQDSEKQCPFIPRGVPWLCPACAQGQEA